MVVTGCVARTRRAHTRLFAATLRQAEAAVACAQKGCGPELRFLIQAVAQQTDFRCAADAARKQAALKSPCLPANPAQLHPRIRCSQSPAASHCAAPSPAAQPANV